MPWIIAAMAGLFVAALFTWIGVNLWYAYENWHYDDGMNKSPKPDDYLWTYVGILIGLSVLAAATSL